MDATLEVRWFGEGAPPEAVERWFDTLEAGSESERTDRYLHTADAGLNVKLREGKVQAKRRLAGGRSVRFGEHVAGRAEPWRKFSFKTKKSHPLSDAGHATGLWMAVEKARRQRTLEDDALREVLAASGEDVEELPGSMEANIELTRTRMDGGPLWWTICVETEGPPGTLEAPLGPVARHFFEGFPEDHALTPEASFGYAKWLLRSWQPEAVAQQPGGEVHAASDAAP